MDCEKFNLKEAACLGIAGNFTGHLEQAGEAAGFAGIKAADKNAPKGIFPTYIPGPAGSVPGYLTVFPFDSDRIVFPRGEQNLQIEPECALVCTVRWNGAKAAELVPVLFGASNDCSVRGSGAEKISMKKNWGPSSKGISRNLIPVGVFESGGTISGYRIASFLVRHNEVSAYGEDSPVSGYSCIYKNLLDWTVGQLNSQQDEGPLENVGAYLNDAGRPQKIVLSIGSTRYTEFGQRTFLQDGDAAVVVLYQERKYSPDDIAAMVQDGTVALDKENSVLWQSVRAGAF